MKPKIFFILVFLVLLPLASQAGEVTLAWDANTEEDLAGYKLHYGLASGIYDHSIDVGNVTEYTITGLDPDLEYFYAATAYDVDGNESDYSDEISYIISAPEPPVYETEYFEDFENGAADWISTKSGNSMEVDGSLFSTTEIDGDYAYFTSNAGTNIHSHYNGNLQIQMPFVFSGKIKIDSATAGIGITFLSDYIQSDSYYRLRRYDESAFYFSGHPDGAENLQGIISTGVVPAAGIWYEFRILVEEEPDGIRTRAKIWQSGMAEPENWQADCYDQSKSHTTGTIGVWSMRSGNKYWDDLKIERFQSGIESTNFIKISIKSIGGQ